MYIYKKHSITLFQKKISLRAPPLQLFVIFHSARNTPNVDQLDYEL